MTETILVTGEKELLISSQGIYLYGINVKKSKASPLFATEN